jgi:ABC-type Mn2+/Zn2+ transport system ATPase subunit
LFTLLDGVLADVPRDKIREQLLEVGFDSSRQSDVVGGLSGGWKMKLELARAMLYNADLLLLDEVCHPIIIPTRVDIILPSYLAYQSCALFEFLATRRCSYPPEYS